MMTRRNAQVFRFCVLFSLLCLNQIIIGQNLEDYAGVTRSDGIYYIDQLVTVNKKLDPIKNTSIIIKKGSSAKGGLAFKNGADVSFGDPQLDASGNLVYNSLGLPIMKSRMSIFELNNSFQRGINNYRNWKARIAGTAKVKFYGVDYFQKLKKRSDFDIAGTGSIEFYNCRLIIQPGSSQYNHFFSNPNIKIDGLVIDHRRGGGACEIAVRPNNPIKNLEVVDHNPGSGFRHLVILSSAMRVGDPFRLYQLKARNVSLWQASSNHACHLVNTRGEIFKSSENTGTLSGFRDFKISAFDADTKLPLPDAVVHIERFGGTREYSVNLKFNASGAVTTRLLQYEQPPGKSRNNIDDNSKYQYVIFNYLSQPIVATHKVKYTREDGTNEELNLLAYKDYNISETDTAVVGAYSSIDNLEQLYDYAKYWKLRNPSIRAPKFGHLLVTATGARLNVADGWNLKLSATAAKVLEVDVSSKTLTIKSSKLEPTVKFKSLIAPTGIIKEMANTSINLPYSDKNRDSYVWIGSVGPTDKVEVKEAGVVKYSKFGEYGFPYKSQSKKYEIVLTLTDGTEAMKFYDLSNTGIENKMSISFVPADKGFKNSDRTILYEAPEKTIKKIEDNKALLKSVHDWMIMMTKTIQKK